MSPELFFAIASFLYFIGVVFLFLKILKNRNSLKDFDQIGTFVTFLGVCFSILALFELNMWISVVITIPALLFWLCVFIFTVKK